MASPLTPDEFEFANAHGPYTHGAWTGRGVTIGNEEALTGRGAFIATTIRSALLRRFSAADLATMTLVDVGCYDGWLTCQLADLPIGRLIGVEPREKNLEKGRAIRTLLGIETRCEFRQGSLETLPELLGPEGADIVVCSGVLHHVSSPEDAIRQLRAVCTRFLFLETICFPTDVDIARLKAALELKDIPYFFGRASWGVSGHKLESSYYDGSATRTSVVSLPSVEALQLFLEVNGCGDITVEADPTAYSRAVPGLGRRFSAVCMTAVPGELPDASQWVEEYERGVISTLLPLEMTSALYQRVTSEDAPLDVATWDHVAPGRFVGEIVKNLRYAPRDKITLEYGKSLIAEGRHQEGQEVLQRLTRGLNADWRAVYRAFCVLSWSFGECGNGVEARRYAELCVNANAQFPQSVLGRPLWFREAI